MAIACSAKDQFDCHCRWRGEELNNKSFSFFYLVRYVLAYSSIPSVITDFSVFCNVFILLY